MKLLIAVCSLQALVLAFLCVLIIRIDARTDEIAGAEARLETLAQAGVAARPADVAGARGPSAADIRRIVREEVAAAEQHTAGSSYRPSAYAVGQAGDAGGADQNLESPQLNAAIQRDLDDYIRRGKMGEVEMADFQQKIARLSPNERREMLRKLTKAINSGDLDAQL